MGRIAPFGNGVEHDGGINQSGNNTACQDNEKDITKRSAEAKPPKCKNI
jgi:hypothetical protein